MSDETAGGRPVYRLPPRLLSPEQAREVTFERAPFGRRGLDEAEVQGYVNRLAEELAARDVEIARLSNENRQLKHALREWHRQLVGYDAAELIARTQQQIELQLAQAEQYTREREEEAAQRYEEILAEARQRARDEADVFLRDEHQGTGSGPNGDPEWLNRQQTYAHALVQALDSLAAQINATRQAFTYEVGQLTSAADGPTTRRLREVRTTTSLEPPPVVIMPAPAPGDGPMGAPGQAGEPPERTDPS